MRCEFFIKNPDTIQDPDKVISRHFGCTPEKYFKDHIIGFSCNLECVPSVGDSLDYNVFPAEINATIVGVITWKCLSKENEKSEPYYSYYVKVSHIRDNE